MKSITIYADLICEHESGQLHISDVEGEEVKFHFSGKKVFREFLNIWGINVFSLGKIRRIHEMLDRVGIGYQLYVSEKLIVHKAVEGRPQIKFFRLIAMFF